MAFNKAREERKWRIRKEAEEQLMRKLGTDEETIQKLREHDLKVFNSEQRFYRRLVHTDTYIDHLTEEEKEKDIYTIDDLLDSIENERLYKALCDVDKLTLRIMLLRLQGFSVLEIAILFSMKEDTVYKRINRFKKKMKKVLK